MLVCVRTTINLPDGLMAQVKARAAASGRTTTSLVEEALRLLLEQGGAPNPYRPMPVDHSGGGFLVDLLDKDSLWEALDERP